jgi:hypothetical protein
LCWNFWQFDQDIPDLDEVEFKDEENQERKSTSTCLLS